jgi:hypothetical protein
MTNQTELQAMLDHIAAERAGVISLPSSGDLDQTRRAAWRQCKDAPDEVQREIDRAVDAAGVVAAVRRLDVTIEWV